MTIGNRPLPTHICPSPETCRVVRTVEGTPLCECGHPREAHGPQEYPSDQSGCRASVFSEDRGSSWPCRCRRFKALL